MKKLILVLLVLSSIMTSCKYEEGPLISFRSVQTRLHGNWVVSEYSSDGVDLLQFYKDSCGCGIQFADPELDTHRWDIVFINCYNTDQGVPCHYNFIDNKKVMDIYSLYQPLSTYGFKSFGPMLIIISWKILRITMDDFKISATINGHDYLVKFKKINY
jgi:hypothetical protein